MAKDAQVYLVFGPDTFMIDKACSEIMERLRPSLDSSFGVEQVDGRVNFAPEAAAAVMKTVEALITSGFFGGGKLVWFKNVSFLDQARISGSTAVKDRLDKLVKLISDGLPSGHILLVSASGLDKRSSFYKICAKSGIIIECAQDKSPWKQATAARTFVKEEIGRYGLHISTGALSALLEKVGMNSAFLSTEITKLDLFLGERRDITEDDIRVIVAPTREYTNFEFLDALGARDMARASTLLRGMLFQKVSPMQIIFMMESHFRELAVFKELYATGRISAPRSQRDYYKFDKMPDKLEQALEKLMKRSTKSIHGYRVSKMTEQAGRFSMGELEKIQRHISRVHSKLVRSGVPPGIFLELAVVRICSSKVNPG